MQKKHGIMLVNLGTPDEPTAEAVKPYLSRFLSDRRVINKSPFIWKPILHGIILNTRPKKSAALYQSIWTEHGSPLLYYSKCQATFLQERLPDVKVALAMSYSHPLIEETLQQLVNERVTDLTVIPLYPQYSGTTVGSVFDDVMKFFIGKDCIPNLKFVRSFYDHPLYINYYVEKIKQKMAENEYDALLFSYHGIPISYVNDGDNYPDECRITTEKIMEQIGDVLHFQTFQSQFGPEEWLKPATDYVIKTLPDQGVKKLLIVAPGFIVDCLETIEELSVENKGYFMENGGQKFDYIPPFNDDAALSDLLVDLYQKNN